jgi:hypothetical protein
MAGSFSDYAESKIVNHILGAQPWNPLTYLYFGYMVGQPSEAGQGAEPNGGGYERTAVDNNTTNFPIANTQIKQNGTEILFAEATANHGTVVAIGVWDNQTGGNMLAYMPLVTPIAVAAGDQMKVPVGAFTHQFQAGGGLSNFVKNAVLNHLYGAIPWNVNAMLHFAYSTTAPTDANPGVEPTGGAYARVAVANNVVTFPLSSTGSKANQVDITFPEATAAQGAATHLMVFDAASAGNYLIACPLQSSLAINIGATPIVRPNQFILQLD